MVFLLKQVAQTFWVFGLQPFVIGKLRSEFGNCARDANGG